MLFTCTPLSSHMAHSESSQAYQRTFWFRVLLSQRLSANLAEQIAIVEGAMSATAAETFEAAGIQTIGEKTKRGQR